MREDGRSRISLRYLAAGSNSTGESMSIDLRRHHPRILHGTPYNLWRFTL